MKNLILYAFALLFCGNLTAQTFTDNYSSATGWTHHSSNNSVTLQNGVVNFNQAYCGGVDEYLHKPLGFTLDDNKWTMDFEWTSTDATSTGTTALIASLTSETSDPAYTASDTSQYVTNNNTISVLYNNCFGCGTSNTGIEMITKRGVGQYVWHEYLHIPINFNEVNYIRCERISATSGMISVFSDAARTQHRAGSPRCFPIDAGITNLKYLQHGVWTPGDYRRATTGTVDNTTVTNNHNNSTPFTSTTTASPPTICPNSSATLDAYTQDYTSYNWSDGSSSYSTTTQQAGTYTVTVTNASGCVGTGSVTVEEGMSPRATIAGMNIPLDSTTTLLTANDAATTDPNTTTYSWSTFDTTRAISAGAGIYTVTVTNSGGCTASRSHTVVQDTLPPTLYFVVQGTTLSVPNPQTGATYQWYFNNAPIQGATNESCTVSGSGVYVVCMNTGNSSQTCSAPLQLAYLATSAKHTIPLVISPNPTNNISRISGLPTQKHQISVFNALGQSVLSVENANTEYNLDFSNFASGVYFLQIQNEVWKIVRKQSV